MSEVFKPIPTEDPSRVSIRVKVSTANLRGDEMPKVGDRYDALKGVDARRTTEGWADYVYAMAMLSQDDGFLEFIYTRPNTAADIAAPVPFRVFPSYESGVYWPPVLERRQSGQMIDFSPDPNFPFQKELTFSNATTSRILAAYNLRPEFTGKTLVWTSLYLSSVPWGPVALEVVDPQPGPVRCNHTSLTLDLGDCLHDEVIIPAFGETSTVFNNSTTANTPPVTEGEIFPATNYTQWEDRRITGSQEYQNGLWAVTIQYAIAPQTIDLTRRLQ